MKVLLVTFYYPPLQTIAAERTAAIAGFLSDMGHEVKVITRFYDKNQQRGDNMLVGFEESSDINEDYRLHDSTLYIRYRKNNRIINKARFIPPGIKGYYLLKKTDALHYGWVEDAVKQYTSVFGNFKPDVVYSSYGPPAACMVGDMLARANNAKHIIEFRDAYIDERDKGWIRKVKIRNQQQLLKNTAGIVFSSQGMKEYFETHFNTRYASCVVYNGIKSGIPQYDKEDEAAVRVFADLKREYKTVLLHTGTVYAGQDIDFFLSAVNPEDVAVVFLGLSKNDDIQFQGNIKQVFIPKVKKSTSVYLQHQASALLFPVWKNRYTGFSGKLLEYLACGIPVLCSPNPQSDLLPFFEASGNVHISSSLQQWNETLQKVKSQQILPLPVKNKAYFEQNFWLEKLHDFIHAAYKV